jgi:hypothetical protein
MGNARRANEAEVPRSRLSQVNPWLYEFGEWRRGTSFRLNIEFLKR